MPRTKEQNEEIRKESIRVIEKAALNLFSEKGFEGASIADIAKKSGVSKALVFRYFPKKETLLESIIKRERDSLSYLIESVQFVHSPRERFISWVDVLFSHLASNSKEMKLLFSLFLHCESAVSLKKIMAKNWSSLESLVLQEKKIIKGYTGNDTEDETYLFRYLVQGVVIEYLLDDDREHLARGKKLVLDVFENKIRSKGSF
ncbi:TetR/AcrR family transcriptional regulator [Leptospira sp. 'Mane']|uniref:TetR/AcrR family transcriptional regulator n=1 Tax=Leptospira sp. 'Mane' TaxID=3387407 RepID=UPI00398B650C